MLFPYKQSNQNKRYAFPGFWIYKEYYMRFYPKDIIKHTNETKTKNTDQLISHHSQEENSVFYFHAMENEYIYE